MIDRARHGDGSELGPLLERYRGHLRLAAIGLFGTALRPRIDPSDVVQETFLKAIRDFPNFQGSNERELLAWLRRILAHCMIDQIKHHKRQLRNHSRQESLDTIIENSPVSARKIPTARGPSPSEAAVRHEQVLLLANAVDRLPPDYRLVYLQRTIEHQPFEVIAARMNRGVGAVRMLWVRAIERLSSLVEESPCS